MPSDLLRDFIESQKTLSSYYANLGEKESNKWSRDASNHPPLFGTPILKPRVPSPKKPNKPPGSRKPVRDLPPPKLKSDENIADMEHGSRLVERRERQRAKRAILHGIPANRDASSEPGENLNGRFSPSKHASKNKKGKKGSLRSKQKVPSGLALMESFAAKNIKRDRLTLKPSSSFGVFNKGKASLQADLESSRERRKKNRDLTFSESDFLKSKQKIRPISVSGSEEEIPLICNVKKMRQSAYFNQNTKVSLVQNATRSSSLKAASTPSRDSESSLQSGPPSPKASSAPWDIELGHELPDEADSDALIDSPVPASKQDSPYVVSGPLQPCKASDLQFIHGLVVDEGQPSTDKEGSLHPSHSASPFGLLKSYACVSDVGNDGNSNRVEQRSIIYRKLYDLEQPRSIESFVTRSHPRRIASPSLTSLEIDFNTLQSRLVHSQDSSDIDMDILEERPWLPLADNCYPQSFSLPACEDFYAEPSSDNTLPLEREHLQAHYMEDVVLAFEESPRPVECGSWNSMHITPIYSSLQPDESLELELHEYGPLQLNPSSDSESTADNIACSGSSISVATYRDSYQVDNDALSESQSLDYGPIFAEGRSLLLGFDGPSTTYPQKTLLPSDMIELEVAAGLKGHWRPQRL